MSAPGNTATQTAQRGPSLVGIEPTMALVSTLLTQRITLLCQPGIIFLFQKFIVLLQELYYIFFTNCQHQGCYVSLAVYQCKLSILDKCYYFASMEVNLNLTLKICLIAKWNTVDAAYKNDFIFRYDIMLLQLD